jgi:hypothetical protein
MDEKEIKMDQYICAKPCPIEKGILQIGKASSNSQAIDLLLIKKITEK